MAFTNIAVDTAGLPDARELELTPMAPAYRREVITQLLIIFTPIFVVSWLPHLLPIRPPTLALVLESLPAGVLALAAVCTWIALKQAKVKGYALRQHDIVYRKGLVFRKTIALPFNRVQHIEVASGPLQRLFGLASLKFFTAGGSGVDLRMDGLAATDAERLREYLLARSEAARYA
jgi:membrane protein YdbS with pleckstrin-like domain